MRFLRCFAALGFLFSGGLNAAERPNILFIFSDDHAPTAISAYGNSLIKTPNFDRLANSGMKFTRALVTNSICAPSRAVVLTGKYSHLNGQKTNKDRFDGSQSTVPKWMRKAGYETAIVGKWHLKSEPTGFDYWHVLPGQGDYYNPKFRTPTGITKSVPGYATDLITDHALDWIKTKRDADKPFYLMLHHKATHGKWDPAPRHLTLFDDRTFPEPDTLFDDYKGRTKAASQHEMGIADHMGDSRLHLVPPRSINAQQLKKWNKAYDPKNATRPASPGAEQTRWNYQRYIHDYLRVVKSLDENIGRTLDFLNANGLADNTVVIYSSDQGFYLGEHGWFDKRWMYEQSLRTPLLVRWPGVTKAGSVNDDMVLNLDFGPTMAEIAGATVPDDVQGRSFTRLLKGEPAPDWRSSMYYHYYESSGHGVAKHEGVATKTHKLIHFYEHGDWELFDLHADPKEMKSVFDDPEYTGVRSSLERELKRLRVELKL